MSEPTAQITEATEKPPGPAHEDARPPEAAPVLVEQDLLVEDVSIDGMCGVY